MTDQKTFYLTTPIYYVNAQPHIGHAYTTVAADILARWKRLMGEKVFFLTGTDEHGSKIARAAELHKMSPQEYADWRAGEFQELWKILNISNDHFIRTTEERHRKTVQNVFQQLSDQGKIFKGTYEGWYCVPCESFRLESELAEFKCPDCGRTVEKEKQESYFFKLSDYTSDLLKFYKGNPKFLSPKFRAKEILHFVQEGLHDLSVSRLNEKWGIPVPQDANHTVYVWFDALINYLTAAGYKADPRSQIRDTCEKKTSVRQQASDVCFEKLWPADVHFVGKEIFRFHTTIWPAMLLALKLPLPKMVFAHGWWTVEGEKMSKSKGNVADPKEVVKEFGADGLRYFLMREIPFGEDGDFSKSAILARYNADLANNLGNLFSRTLTLIEKNFNGHLSVSASGKLLGFVKEATEQIRDCFDSLEFSRALEILNSVVAETNRYLDKEAPWNLVKSDLTRAQQVLSECFVILRWLAVAYSPFLPHAALLMWKQLGEKSDLQTEGKSIFSNPREAFPSERIIERGPALFPRK